MKRLTGKQVEALFLVCSLINLNCMAILLINNEIEESGWRFLFVTFCVLNVGLFFQNLAKMMKPLWNRLEEKYSVFLTEKYRRRYEPHAEDEAFLKKEYADVSTLATFLNVFHIGKTYQVKMDVLYELITELESKYISTENVGT